MSTRQIAGRLNLTADTVQDHLKSVFDRTGVHSRGQLVATIFKRDYLPHAIAGDPLQPSRMPPFTATARPPGGGPRSTFPVTWRPSGGQARTAAALTACAAGASARPTAARPTTGSAAVGRPLRKTFITEHQLLLPARQDLARKAHQVVRTGPIEADIRFSAAVSALARTAHMGRLCHLRTAARPQIAYRRSGPWVTADRPVNQRPGRTGKPRRGFRRRQCLCESRLFQGALRC